MAPLKVGVRGRGVNPIQKREATKTAAHVY